MKLFAIKGLSRPGGGAERVLVDIANGLTRRGHDIGIVTYDKPVDQSFYKLDHRIEWHRLGIGRTDQPATWTETLRRIVALRHTILPLKPEIAVGFLHSVFIPLGLALIGTRIPVVASEHTAPVHYATRPLQRALLHLAPCITSHMTVVSDQILSLYPKSHHHRLSVLPNPVQLAVASQADVRGSNDKPKVLLCVGRLAAQKDHATLISAFALIAEELPDWNLHIVGEGELRPNLTAQINDLRLADRIFLPGAAHDISSQYLAAQLFVLPSLYETLGLAVVEALAHGLPVIGFADCAGVNKLVIQGYNGALVSGADRIEALAQSMRLLMSNAELRQKLVQPATAIPEECQLDRVLDLWETMLERHCDRQFAPATVTLETL